MTSPFKKKFILPVIASAFLFVGVSFKDDFFEYLDYYRKALDLYFLGGWNLSKEYFERCLQLASNDVAANCMLKRCIDFANNPPSDWDGATSLTTK